MTVETFATYAQSRHFQGSGALAVGLVGNYPASMTYAKINMVSQVTLTVPVEKEQAKGLRKTLAKQLGRLVQVVTGEESLNFVVAVSDKNIETRLDDLCQRVPEALKEHGVTVPQCCPICGNTGCDVYARIKNAYRPAHRSCVKNHVADIQEQAQTSIEAGNYLTGALGAILGAIVGGIPSVISILLTNSIFSILYALIPICSYKGYQLMKGRMDKMVLPITIVFSVLGAVLVDFLSVCIQIYTQFDRISIGIVSMFFQNPDFQKAYLTDSASSLFFVALGIWVSWSYIKRNAVTTVKDASDVADTMIPISQEQESSQR